MRQHGGVPEPGPSTTQAAWLIPTASGQACCQRWLIRTLHTSACLASSDCPVTVRV